MRAIRFSLNSVLLLVMLVACWQMRFTVIRTVSHWNSVEPPSWASLPMGSSVTRHEVRDRDTLLIHTGLTQAPRFRDTLRWWTGPWVGIVPFYRPVSSLVFWCEWKLCGDHEARYLVFAMLLHLLAVYQFLRLAHALFRYFRCPFAPWATLFAGLFFVDGGIFLVPDFALFPGRRQTVAMIYAFWKNQPDVLCALFFFLALRCYLRLLTWHRDVPIVSDTATKGALGQALARYRRFAAAEKVCLGSGLLCYVLCCGSKEVGVFLPLILVFLEMPNVQRAGIAGQKSVRWRLLPFLLALPAFLLVRAWCLGNMTGYQYGTNHAWGFRLITNLFGAEIGMGMVSFRPAFTFALTLFLLYLVGDYVWCKGAFSRDTPLTRRLLWGSIPFAALALVGLPYASEDMPLYLRPLSFLFFLTDATEEVLADFLLFVGFWNAFRQRAFLALFGFSWATLGLLLILVSPGPVHRFYLVDGGLILLVTGGLMLWGRARGDLYASDQQEFADFSPNTHSVQSNRPRR